MAQHVRPGRPRPSRNSRVGGFSLSFFVLTLVTGPSPWLGADASGLDILPLLARRLRIGPHSASEWWPKLPSESDVNLQEEVPLAPERTPEEVMESVFLGWKPPEIGFAESPRRQEGLERSLPSKKQQPEKPFPVTLDDLVIAIPTHKATEPQILAGRAARLGIRTVVVTNYTQSRGAVYPAARGEVWTDYPDATPARSFYAGDDRAALAPFLAFRALGDGFKWLFYGDDDTAFFADAALELASGLDPDLPYFVTDNLWFSEGLGPPMHPHPLAPRCLPCGYTKDVEKEVGMKMTPGCPCTPALICSLQDGYNGTFSHGGCGVPRPPIRAYSMHGGAGALISIGLLRQVDWQSMERCVNHQWSSGGDAFISICLWEQGFAHTTPDPAWHPAGLQMFDPSPAPLNPDDFITWKASHIVGNLLQAAVGVCQGLCELELKNTVTLHLRARRVSGSNEGAAAFVRSVSRLYSRVTGRLTPELEQVLSDATSRHTQSLAARIDAMQATAAEAVGRLIDLQKTPDVDPWQKDHSKLDLRLTFGTVSAIDAVRSGVADAIASRLLNDIMKLVEPLASGASPEEALQAAKLPWQTSADDAAALDQTS